MIRFTNRYISTYRLMFFLIDSLLLLGAVAGGYLLRLGWNGYVAFSRHLSNRGLFFVIVFQVSLYYFEMYELKTIRDAQRFSLRFAQSMLVAIIVLIIAAYVHPVMYLGRGVLLYTVGCAIVTVFFWRVYYRSIVSKSQLNERILIVGTGEFAKEIAKQIHDKGDSGFEVIGHISETRETEERGRERHETPAA